MKRDKLDNLTVEEKKELLRRLLSQQGSSSAYHPLSYTQKKVVELDGLESVTRVTPTVLRLKGEVESDRLERYVNWIIRGHETLNTVMVEVNGKCYMKTEEDPFRILQKDFRNLPVSQRLQNGEKWIAAEAARPYVLQAPLLRVGIAVLGDQEFLLFVCMHHLIADETSVEMFTEQLLKIYRQSSILSPVDKKQAEFSDFREWQKQRMEDGTWAREITFWRKRLSGLPEPALPFNRHRIRTRREDMRNCQFQMNSEIKDLFRKISKDEGVDLFVLFLSAWKLFLYRHVQRTDISVGISISERAHLSNIKHRIGPYDNRAVIRTDLSCENLSFRNVIHQVQKRVDEAHNNRCVPFIKVVEALELDEVSPFGCPVEFRLAPVLFEGDDSLRVHPYPLNMLPNQSSAVLSLYVETGSDLTASFRYDANCFSDEIIQQMASQFHEWVLNLGKDPEQNIHSVLFMTRKDREMLMKWNRTETEYPNRCVHEQFEKWAEKLPDSTAVVQNDHILTYEQLNRKANQLAHYLRRVGVSPGVKVGLYIPRSLEMMVGMLAIFKSGGVYVPLDNTYPEERLKFILEDSGIDILITKGRMINTRGALDAKRVDLDTDQQKIDAESSGNPVPWVSPGDKAYIIYTSGSTGKPKGVVLNHLGLNNLVYWFHHTYSVKPDDRTTQVARMGFDASLFEIWPYWTAGASIFLVDQETLLSAKELRDWMVQKRITISHVPPVVAEQLIQLEWPQETSLRALLTGSDRLVRRPSTGLPFRYFNHYGPTEYTVICSSGEVLPETPENKELLPDIGRPLFNTEIYILDPLLQTVPPGVPGELCVAGAGIAQGYLNRPVLTQEKFVPHPFRQNQMLYRTGDMARFLPDGRIDFLGRADHQVKIRGFRVELGEIESVLSEHPTVQAAVVTLQEHSPEDQRLVAYVVGDGTVKEWREHVLSHLPSYMVPAHFVAMESLPLTPNGKVNRKALPVPKFKQPGESSVELSTPVEELITAVWCSVLKMENIGLYDSFFELGGHSLLATQVRARLQESFGIELPLRELFEHPTVKALGKRVGELLRKETRRKLPTLKQEVWEESIPLSYTQQRLWFLDQLFPNSPLYNIPAAWRLKGEWVPEVLEKALHALIQRHETLRTEILEVDGQPVQQIRPFIPQTWPMTDLSDLDPEKREYEMKRLVQTEAETPFDLDKGPLIRVQWIRMDRNEWVLLCTMHHIIFDEWSMNIFLEEWLALYEEEAGGKPADLNPLPVQYVDFTKWQREWLKDKVIEQQLCYWKEELSGKLPVLQLPMDRPRPAIQTHQGDTHQLLLPNRLLEKLKNLGLREGTTLFMTLLAAYQGFLYRYTGQEDILVGSPVANRNHKKVEGLIGLFVNTLVYRADMSENPTFQELLTQTRQKVLKAHENQDVPFEKVVEEVQPERSTSYSPIFQTMFIMQTIHREQPPLSGRSLELMEIRTSMAKFDLTVAVQEIEEGLRIVFEYKTDLFDASTIARMAEHFGNWLNEVVQHPKEPLGSINIISKGERQQLLEDWNDTKVAYPRESVIPKLFEEQVNRAPEAVAVVHKGDRLTYRELNERANQLAHYLQKRGIGPDSLVGICLERSPEMIIGLLGILKAGGAYVPLDPAYPEKRLHYILEDTGIEKIVTQGVMRHWIPEEFEAIDLNHDQGVISRESALSPTSGVTSENLAYVIYTSGSTGDPKGVMVEHGSLMNLMKAMTNTIDFEPSKPMLSVTTISFDISALETLLPLTRGQQIVVASEEEQRDPQLLGELIVKHGVRMIQSTPSRYQLLLQHDELASSLMNVTEILVGGEALPEHVLAGLRRYSNARIYNLYGPTETTVWSTVKEVTTGAVSIGKPIANTQTYVLNPSHHLQPIGVTGELYIAGDGLARGYWNRPTLTAERFIPHPFSNRPGARLYRTGDLARYLPDGNLEYLGRADHQVKVRGFRIELGEIETVLTTHPRVEETVVSLQDRHLVAYVVPRAETGISVDELREFLEEELPNYMIPSVFHPMSELPLTVNGKVDRKALSEVDVSPQMAKGYVPPRNETEKEMTMIWAQVLGMERIGIRDNFFDLGGHSLKASVLAARVSKVFGKEVPLRQVFENPTIEGLVKSIEAGEEERFHKIRKLGTREYYPASAAQKRLYTQWHLDPEVTLYNMPDVRRIEGKVDKEGLESTFMKLIRRHESLRTSFELVEGDLMQRIHREFDFAVTCLRVLPEDLEQTFSNFIRPFDLRRGPLLRVALVECASEFYLVMDMHHIISDGTSMGVLAREFTELYEGKELPPLNLQYKDFAVWQNSLAESEEMKRQEQYWLKVFGDKVPMLELATDFPRPQTAGYYGGTYRFQLEEEWTEKLWEKAREQGATLFMILLASFHVLLSRWSGSEDIVIGTPVAGRSHADLEGIVGMFVNTLALRNHSGGHRSFSQFLRSVRENALEAFENQDYQFDMLVKRLNLHRDLSRHPLFDALFVLQNMEKAEVVSETFCLKPDQTVHELALVDVGLYAEERDGKLQFEWRYRRDLFRKETVERMMQGFVNILREVGMNPNRKISDIPALSHQEEKQVLFDFNATEKESRDELIHQRFEKQVQLRPDKPAIVFKGKVWSYQELNERANQLARVLREQGVGREVPVGLLMERSADLVVGMLATLKAGGFYVPIDQKYPIERVRYMLQDSGAAVLVGQAGKTEEVGFGGQVIGMADWRINTREKTDLPVINRPEDLAYVLYTSGSTGQPKGVQIEHRSIHNFIEGIGERVSFVPEKTVLSLTTPSFDMFEQEILLPLVKGMKVVVADSHQESDSSAMLELIREHPVHLMQMTPSRLQVLLEHVGGKTLLSNLTDLILGGEEVPYPLLEKLKRITKARVYNGYGPTETTVCATMFELDNIPSSKVSPRIGQPLTNTRIYILGPNGEVQPIGVAGELCIAGKGVARGYLNRPELTADKFVPDPFVFGERMFKTGDLARWLSDGNLEFMGRKDDQVKLHGYRIETGEVVNHLLNHPFIDQACVQVRIDPKGVRRLCAYYAGSKELEASELREHLRAFMPHYMIPTAFVRMEDIPLTPNGKINRHALPEPIWKKEPVPGEKEPATEWEKTILTVWKDVLETETIDLDDDFFDLGGHSLLAIKMEVEMEKRNLPFRQEDIYQYKTVRELAHFMEKKQSEMVKKN